MTAAKTATSAAVDVGSKVYENLTKMQDLVTKWSATSDVNEKAEYQAEFNSLRDTASKSLTNAKVDGQSIADGAYTNTVSMDPNGGSLTVDLTTNADATAIDALDITAGAATTTALQTQVDDALTYMSDAKSFDNILNNQISLNKTIVNSKEAVKSLITDIDEASEMSKMLDQNVRQQAAMSMLSQANMSRQVVMKLY
jgi:flagellin